jgi:LacI family transcriptional regulator
MTKKPSIYDIAKKLNITASTVSRALRRHSNISADVIKEVHRVAKELNYQRNAVAVNLKQGHTRMIGVVIPQLNRQFFSSAINGIEEMASEEGYNVIICQTRNDVNQEKKAMQMLSQNVVDGILISVVTDKSDYNHFRSLQDRHMPMVFFDRYPLTDGFKRVCLDDYNASSHAVAHLASLGRKKIFHFSGYQDVSIWRERTRGYLDQMKRLKLGMSPDWIFENTLNHEAGIAAAEKMIANGNVPDALFSSSDHPLLGALFAFRKNGFRIPEDIALVGYGNEMFTAYTDPSLSTIDQRSYEMGKEAFAQLLKVINGESIPDEIVLTHELIVRGSSTLN